MKISVFLLAAFAVPGFAAPPPNTEVLENEHSDDVIIKPSNKTKANCKSEKRQVPTPCPDPPSPKLPMTCSGASGVFQGDPHIITFDGVKYDCMGEGEFTLSKSIDNDDKDTGFYLQGRFARPRETHRETSTKAVVFSTGDGEPKIQVDAPPNKDNGCGGTVFLEGVKIDVDEEAGKYADGIHIQKRKVATKTGEAIAYTFYYEDSHVQLEVMSQPMVHGRNGCVLQNKLCIPDCYHRKAKGERFVGLLGSPDGDKDNDWTDPTGTKIYDQDPTNSDATYEFCVPNFCIRDPNNSLFTYDNGMEFEDYYKCRLPKFDPFQNCAVSMEELDKVCGANGGACKVDGCVGGINAAIVYVKNGLQLVDKNCGKELFYDDFEQDFNYGDFGMKEPATLQSSHAHMATNYLIVEPDNNSFQKTFAIAKDANLAHIEFLFYEFGDWEVGAGETDALVATINDVEIKFGRDSSEDSKDGVIGQIAWTKDHVASNGDMGCGEGGQGKDRISKISLYVPDEVFSSSGSLKVTLKAVMVGDDRAGYDEFHVTAYQRECQKIDCSGVKVISEDFDPGSQDAAGWGADSTTLPDGQTILGPLKSGNSISSTLMVPSHFDIASIEFLLYEMGTWETSQFWVTIHGVTFDIGPFLVEESRQTVTTDDQADSKIHWERKALTKGSRLVGDGDRIHAVSINVTNDFYDAGFLTVGFDVEGGDDVSAGIDRFRIRMFPDPAKCKAAQDKKIQDVQDKKTCPHQEPTKPKKCYREEVVEVCAPTPSPKTAEPRSVAPIPKTKTPAPTPAPTPKGSTSGDPHFKLWNGDKYDYHGECDLVLIDNPSFAEGLGLRLHIRTTTVKYFSFIEKAALQIGDDVLEFTNSVENFLINGVKVEENRKHHKTKLGKYVVRRDPKALSIRLADGTGPHQKTGAAKIDFHVRKNGFPGVVVDAGYSDIFEGSLGLLGEWGTGRTLARDGNTVIPVSQYEATEFALEWQVRNGTDPILFRESRYPQFPTTCTPPANMPHGLESSPSSFRKEAEEACSHWTEDQQDCIFDVIATRDVLVAEEGHIMSVM